MSIVQVCGSKEIGRVEWFVEHCHQWQIIGGIGMELRLHLHRARSRQCMLGVQYVVARTG